MIFVDLKSGESVEGDIISAYKSDVKNNKYLYLMAGVHGEEVEGVYVLKQLFEWLQENDDLDLPIVVIPIMNVDGYRARTRVNSHGVDLNRNCPTKSWSPKFKKSKNNPGPSALSEPENKYLVGLFEKFPPALIISFHSWKPLLNYNGDCKDVAEFIGQFNNYPLVSDFEYPTPGCLGEYGPEKYNSPVLTFECPPLDKDIDLKQIWDQNREGLTELIKSDLIRQKIGF